MLCYICIYILKMIDWCSPFWLCFLSYRWPTLVSEVDSTDIGVMSRSTHYLIMVMTLSASVFETAGSAIMRREADLSRSTGSRKVFLRRFKGFFGAPPVVVSAMWRRLTYPERALPCHLLWAFLLLKSYANEHQCAALCAVDEKTFRKWSWLFVRSMARAKIVRRLSSTTQFKFDSLSNNRSF